MPVNGGSQQRKGSERTLNERSDRNDKHNSDSSDRADEEEKGGQQGPPLPVGFLDKRLHSVRIEVAKKWALTTIILMSAILLILSLYWAVLFRVNDKLDALNVVVVDFDATAAPYQGVQAFVGPAVTQLARQTRKAAGTLGWEVRPPSEFNYDPIAVRRYVYDQHAWAAIVINNNATALLQDAVRTGNRTYDPLGACQMIYVQARDETTAANYITPQLTRFAIQATSQVGRQFTAQTLSNPSLNASVYSQAPQALSPAIGFSIFNLRPFSPPTANPAVSIGLIYLIIIAFFSFSFYLPIYNKMVTPDGHPPMHFWELMLWRLGMILLTYLFLSLAYSLVSLAFQIPFSNTGPHPATSVVNNPTPYGKASFVVYWLLNFTGMIALGLASENVTMLIGQPWTALWLIFWVITNVSTSFYEIPLAPAFFRWGYAWPLHNIVKLSRTILFDVPSQTGLNWGILVIWAVINIVFFFPCAVFFRYKNTKDKIDQVPRSKWRWLLDG